MNLLILIIYLFIACLQKVTSIELEPNLSLKEHHFQTSNHVDSLSNPNSKPITHIEKTNRVGIIGSKILVPLPTKTLEYKRGQPEKGYWHIEQRVVRKAKNLIKKGKYTDKNEAILAAHKEIKDKMKSYEINRKVQNKVQKRIQKKGYQTRISWTFRKMASILQSDHNQITDLGQARDLAEKHYKEKLSKNAARQKLWRQRKKLESQKVVV